MNHNVISDQEVVDYIESSATLIDNLKSEVKKLASEKSKLEQELISYKEAFAKKASEAPVVKTKQILLNKDQADLIANNLVGLNLIKNASIADVSEALQHDTSKMVQVFNGLISKIASSHSTGRGIAPEKTNIKTLTEDEELEKAAFYSKR